MRAWIGMDAARGRERVVEIAEHHREHVRNVRWNRPTTSARGSRVVIDRVRDHRVRELQQRRATATQKHREIATEPPRDRVGTEDPGARIAHALRKRGERRSSSSRVTIMRVGYHRI